MTASTNAESSIREGIQTQLALLPLDKIIGQPTIRQYHHLKKQLAKLAAAVKTTEWGGRHGHIALVLTEAHMRTVTGNPLATVALLPQPPNVPAGLLNNSTLTNRTRITTDHANAWQNFYKQESVQGVIVDRLVLEAVDSDYVEELEDEYLGYSRETIKTVLTHIKTNYCTITTLDKKEAKDAFEQLWNGQGHITKFARNLDRKQEWCTEINVNKTDGDKVQVYVESMYAIELFDDKDMQVWEDKTNANKTWANAKTYFEKEWKTKSNWTKERKTRRSGYESANSVANQSHSDISTAHSYHTANEKPPGTITTNQGGVPEEMLEYTNSLEASLEEAKEANARLATEKEMSMKLQETSMNMQEKLMAQMATMQKQQQDMNEKFMKSMASLASGNNTGNEKGNGTGKERRSTAPHTCPHCKKEKVTHLEQDCRMNPINKK